MVGRCIRSNLLDRLLHWFLNFSQKNRSVCAENFTSIICLMNKKFQTNPFHYIQDSQFVHINKKLETYTLKINPLFIKVISNFHWNRQDIKYIFEYILKITHNNKYNKSTLNRFLKDLLDYEILIGKDPFDYLGDLRSFQFPQAFFDPEMSPYLKGVISLRKKFIISPNGVGLKIWDKDKMKPVEIYNRWIKSEDPKNMRFACNKKKTLEILKKNNIPTPPSFCFKTNRIEKAWDIMKSYRCEWVIKPVQGGCGEGVTVGIHTKREFINAINEVLKLNTGKILVQHRIQGNDYRVWFCKNKFVGAIERIRPTLVGDGKSTIRELLYKENRKRKNSVKYEITKSYDLKLCLSHQQLSYESIPKRGFVFYVHNIANISSGGIRKDVSDKVHPELIKIFKKAIKLSGLIVCGLDYIGNDISLPFKKSNGKIIELNAQPGVASWRRGDGMKTFVAKEILKILLKSN